MGTGGIVVRPTYRARNKDGRVPAGQYAAGDGWLYFYDVGEEELAYLRKTFDTVRKVLEIPPKTEAP